jgi:hypothetical protein
MKMRVGILLALMVGAKAWASVEDTAQVLIYGDNIKWIQTTALYPVEPIPDPLICRRAQNKMDHLQRLERQRAALLKKMNDDPSSFSDADLTELTNLENRLRESYNFLAQPAPALIASWSLERLSAKQIDRLNSGHVGFRLQSYALIWEGNGESLDIPIEFGAIFISRVERTLKLILRSSLVNFCSRQPTMLTISI